MNLDELILWGHLVGASIWVGGLFAVLTVTGVLLAGQVKVKVMRASYVAWMGVAWTGMILAVTTGIILTVRQERAWDDNSMGLKLALVVGAAMLSILDGWLIFRTQPWVREIFGALILIFNLGIVGASIAL